MRTRLIPAVLLAVSTLAAAQQKADTAHTYGWKHSLVSQLTLTQVSFTDWAQGGDNALAYTASIDGKEEQDLEKTNWSTTYHFAYGQASIGDKGTRKTPFQFSPGGCFS